MQEKDEIIIPEVLDEQGQIIQANEPPAWNDPRDHARPKGDTSGLLGGFITFLFGLTVTVCVLIFTVCLLIPLALIGRIFGLSVKTSRR